jgi:hypothetical protein
VLAPVDLGQPAGAAAGHGNKVNLQ